MKMSRLLLILMFLFVTESAAMQLTSPHFSHQNVIPQKYTCKGENINPALQWNNVPENTKSFALLVEDPDAPSAKNPRPEGPWVHWIVFNIPATTKELEENVLVSKLGAVQGMTDAKKPKYHGPCPPKGSGQHRYFFKLFALDTVLDLKAGATKKELLAAIKNHILATAELMGTYEIH